MCGIAGWLGRHHQDAEDTAVRVEHMGAVLSHRGPDDHGFYQDPQGLPLFLAHRRLAIIDPERGRQPMVTPDGDLALVFNGAIYNYLEIRRELLALGHPIRSYSDTEVILYAYRQWGEECLEHFNGMFAFALWDRPRRRLFAARDRMGIKPFYYYFDGRRLLFASEIKALFASAQVAPELDSRGLADYLALQFVLGDKTMFRGVQRLEPGHALRASLEQDRVSLETWQWWDLDFTVDTTRSAEAFVEELKFLLGDAVRLRLRSDVPVGAHLSGGLDSSTVVCLASQQLGGARFTTFTGAFQEGREYDETAYARLVAEHAGVDHLECFPTAGDFAETLPRLMYHMDEPAAGPGLFPQYMVSRLASQHVKVVLGGQGGDEIFLGYTRYLLAYLEACLKGAIQGTADPESHAVTLETIIPSLPLLRNYVPMMQRFWRQGLFEESDRRYWCLVSRGPQGKSLVNPDLLPRHYQPWECFRELFNRKGQGSLINRIAYYELKASLPALLQVEDRASMAVGLESRLPLLDHRIVELVARVPPVIKFRHGCCKYLLNQAVRHLLPPQVIQRQDKMGFPVPLNLWCEGPLRQVLHDKVLVPARRRKDFYYLPALEPALSRGECFGRVAWGLICLELWQQTFLDRDPAPLSWSAPPPAG